MRPLIVFFFLFLSFFSVAQTTDSTRTLSEVVIKGFAYNRPLREVPASIAIVGKNELERFNNTSLLPVINTIAGVRMEERSPGSFRLSIRGSSLRSPFGIRNVKFYWNDLPLTDGGGNTYLNLMDFNSIGQLEIIKGPGGSLYGAGNGGVLLLTSPSIKENEIQLSASVGSYGLQRYQASVNHVSKNLKTTFNYAHQQADGYREQTNMRRDALNLNIELAINSKGILSTTLFYTDLFYQTPGGLTKAQYDADPHQARPGTSTLPGAVEQQAAVYNQTFYGGIKYDYQWNDRLSTKIGGYGSITDFKNPAIANYEKRTEENWGVRMETQYSLDQTSQKIRLTFGGEFQHFHSPIVNYANVKGSAGSLQFDDKLTSTSLITFAQAEIDVLKTYFVTIGAGGSFINYRFNRVSVDPAIVQNRNFDPVISPRIAILKKATDNLSFFASVSKGFSPPTLAEVRPSTNNYNDSLKAETGFNVEVGVRGKAVKAFSYDLTLYALTVNQTIVVQRKINNADYFINAGSSSQLGAEVSIAWNPIISQNKKVSALKIWNSNTFNDYHFNKYVQNGIDNSGKQLTGTPATIIVAGIDVKFINQLYVNSTFNFIDRIPLNDANSEYAPDYFLAGLRIGYLSQTKPKIEVWLGVDNALDQKYSLGNDLNAAGGRFYNAAAGRNFYFGIKMGLGY
ncbi:MAG: TonB-dependent receptor [Cyclobacteriaceae bacterium]